MARLMSCYIRLKVVGMGHGDVNSETSPYCGIKIRWLDVYLGGILYLAIFTVQCVNMRESMFIDLAIYRAWKLGTDFMLLDYTLRRA